MSNSNELSEQDFTDAELQATLFTFRSELDKNMSNNSSSPGHDAMRVALRKLFELRKGRALQDQKHHPMSSQDNPSSGGVEGERDRARNALRQLLDTLDCCDTRSGFVWTKKDRREFLQMAGLE